MTERPPALVLLTQSPRLLYVESAYSSKRRAQSAHEIQQEVRVGKDNSIIMAQGKTVCPHYIRKHIC